MNIKPLNDNLVVKPESKDDKTESGIIIPNSAQEKPDQGEVVAVGPGRKLDNGELSSLDIKKGDTIIYNKYSIKEIVLDEEDYVIIKAQDVLAVIE